MATTCRPFGTNVLGLGLGRYVGTEYVGTEYVGTEEVEDITRWLALQTILRFRPIRLRCQRLVPAFQLRGRH